MGSFRQVSARVARGAIPVALVALFVVSAIRNTAPAHSSPPPGLRLDPAEVKLSGDAAAQGALFRIAVVADGVEDFGAFEFRISFDTAFFKFGGFEVGPFLGSTGRQVICQKVNSSEGYAVLGCNTEGPAPPGPDGSGIVAWVDLTVQRRSAGDTSIFLTNCDGSDILGKEIVITGCKRAKVVVNPPTPTPTPPDRPRFEKLPVLQNVFLTRQGGKIPPVDCASGGDIAKLEERLSSRIPNVPDPKRPGFRQHLGAFEFEVLYDEKKVCVELVPGPAAGHMTCLIEDDVTKFTVEGLARIGCVSPGKDFYPDTQTPEGRYLADVLVRPQAEVYSQAKPDQDNGVVVQVLDAKCGLADLQGHGIPVFGCDDADVTFRYLEGDVTADCIVDAVDTQSVAFRWGARKGSLLYSEFMNLEPSGVQADEDIDVLDLQFVFGRFNSTCDKPHPPQPPVNPKGDVPQTPTPTVTPTPTPDTDKPRVNLWPPAQEMLLTSAPASGYCKDSPDAVTFDLVIKDEIVSPDPKTPELTQQLGAFEFELQYSSTWLCVEIEPGDIPEDEMACLTLQGEGVITFGCTTSSDSEPPAPKPPGVLAVVTVWPMTDLFAVIDPGEKWLLELFPKGCKLSDLLGHTIKSTECGEAVVSIRHPDG